MTAIIQDGLAFVFATEGEAKLAHKTLKDGNILRLMRNLIVPEEVFESFRDEGDHIYVNERRIDVYQGSDAGSNGDSG